MGEEHSLIKIDVVGSLTKPATLLIEKICDAVGGIARPWQIRRVAHAEADAKIIETTAQVEVTELARRALYRFVDEETKKQINIEDITQKALPGLSENSRPQDVENDWIVNFFDKCRLVSDDQMQLLWAKVLSGEANSPGSFSKRAVNLMASLDKSDAELFSKLCSFCWHVGSELSPLVYDIEAPHFIREGISFGTLKHLDDIGLVRFENLTGFVIRWDGIAGTAKYYGRLAVIVLAQPDKREAREVQFVEPPHNCEMDVGHVLLTKVGCELAEISEDGPLTGFFEHTIDGWKKRFPHLTINELPVHPASGDTAPSSAPTDNLSQDGHDQP